SVYPNVQTNLSTEPIKNEIVFLPPLSEQQQIVEYLDEQTQLIDRTITIEEKRIELLKEYRQSLISEVVTGKRKVVE
ncbi:MAG: restriction endonuclease subunit S, partial [Flavobacteriaceae bacterium]|nr:restriction endonuclease subunit S [Flavobacteriaceae bacterium]MCI5087525.1 restriction endonuclease subunit S [Flavobacteriaceae bacterium]